MSNIIKVEMQEKKIMKMIKNKMKLKMDYI